MWVLLQESKFGCGCVTAVVLLLLWDSQNVDSLTSDNYQ